jgi:glycosyltransferase involved in cell wall biosynthesis
VRKTPLSVTLYSDAAFYGGAEVYLTLLARHLDRERVRLSALVPDDPPVERLEKELREAGVTIRRHRRLAFRWWEAFGALREELRRIQGDVLHLNLPSTYDAGLSSVAVAARLAGYHRVVATEHLPMIRRRYRRFPVKFLMSEAVDLFLVPAEASRRFLVDLHRIPWEKTSVIPLGVEDPPESPPGVEESIRAATATPRGTIALAVVGSLTPRKGHRILIEALSILKQSADPFLPDFRTWVIGEGEGRADLEALVRSRDLGGTVRFLGGRPDAASLMRLIDLLVVPSLVETTPFVVLEAMAAGRPVVASRIFGIPEILVEGETGLLVRPKDPADLARALLTLLKDGSARERMGRAARGGYEARFTAGRMARETEAAYRGDRIAAGPVDAADPADAPGTAEARGTRPGAESPAGRAPAATLRREEKEGSR